MGARQVLGLLAAVGVLGALGSARATDEPDETDVIGRSAIIRTGRVAKCVMKPIHVAFDLPDVPANDPTIEGGTIKFYERGNPGNANTFALLAAGWRKLGSDPGNPTGYRYRGTGLTGDPCRKVVVKAGAIRAVCKGPEVTLTPPLASAVLGVTLTLGTDSKRYCPVYGAARNDLGLFRAFRTTNAGAPCSPSGAFVDLAE
jgi:hypothetical protein